MPLWEYCEVAYTPKQVLVHVYSSRENGMYEGSLEPEGWGALLTQLGADSWEMVGVVSAKKANHSLYYFKRPIDESAQTEWEERKAAQRESTEKMKEQRAAQRATSSEE